MIKDILEKQVDFTSTEKTIADYILKHPSYSMSLTADELAEKTFTSKASVVRLAKKCETKGYRDFQNSFLLENKELNKAEKILSKEVISNDTKLRDILDAVPDIYESYIHRTKAKLSLPQIERCLKLLKKCDCIEIYGTGITYTLAQEEAYKLNSIGIPTYAYSGLNEHAAQSQNKIKKCALLLTFTGGNPEIAKIASFLKQYNYSLIGIGGDEEDTVQKECNEYVAVDSTESILAMEVLTQGTSIRYVLDVLFASLLVSDYESNVEAAKQLYVLKHTKK